MFKKKFSFMAFFLIFVLSFSMFQSSFIYVKADTITATAPTDLEYKGLFTVMLTAVGYVVSSNEKQQAFIDSNLDKFKTAVGSGVTKVSNGGKTYYNVAKDSVSGFVQSVKDTYSVNTNIRSSTSAFAVGDTVTSSTGSKFYLYFNFYNDSGNVISGCYSGVKSFVPTGTLYNSVSSTKKNYTLQYSYDGVSYPIVKYILGSVSTDIPTGSICVDTPTDKFFPDNVKDYVFGDGTVLGTGDVSVCPTGALTSDGVLDYGKVGADVVSSPSNVLNQDVTFTPGAVADDTITTPTDTTGDTTGTPADASWWDWLKDILQKILDAIKSIPTSILAFFSIDWDIVRTHMDYAPIFEAHFQPFYNLTNQLKNIQSNPQGSDGKFYMIIPKAMGGDDQLHCVLDLTVSSTYITWGRTILKYGVWIGLLWYILRILQPKLRIS